MKYNVKIEGVVPLLMHSPVGLKKKNTATRGKATYDDVEEAEKCVYRTSSGQIYVPSSAILGTMREAGKSLLVGGRGKTTYKKLVMGGLSVEPEQIPLIADPEYIVDTRRAVVQGQGIIRSRPRFEKWACEFTITSFDPERLDEVITHQILDTAGKYIGLLDFRPQFGRFTITSFEEIPEAT